MKLRGALTNRKSVHQKTEKIRMLPHNTLTA